MVFMEERFRIEMPERISTVAELGEAQLRLTRAVGDETAVQELPLAAACGRVLADDVAVGAHVLPAGSRLDWQWLPLLAARGKASVPVRAPVRCGIVTLQVAATHELSASASVIQAALEQAGGRASRFNAAGGMSQEALVLRMFAKFCDLILVIGAADAKADAAGLPVPQVLDVDGRPCITLSAGPQGALSGFVAFVVPLLRRLQGRSPALPRLRTAADGADLPEGVMSWVRGEGDGCSPHLRSVNPAPGDALAGLTRASGIAWPARDGVAYLPFREWLV